jgi:hypothetical protein
MSLRLDLNNPVLQEQWFALEKPDRAVVLNSCVKLAKMEWHSLFRDNGLRWEMIHSRKHSGSEALYSLRITQKIRAVTRRTGNTLELLTLHPDHDSPY